MAELDVPFERTAVGDRYVHERMLERNWQLGGETSGHIICLDRARTGDALVAALQVLEALQILEMPLHQARAGLSKRPQVMINVRCSEAAQSNSATEEAVREAQRELGSGDESSCALPAPSRLCA